MSRKFFFFVLFFLCTICAGAGGLMALEKDYPIRPVDFTHVQFTDTFWLPRLETNRTVTIPYAFRMNEETGRIDNFRKAARLKEGAFMGRRYNDSDVFKAMEGTSYSLQMHPDPVLRAQMNELIRIIGLAQEPDGYLYTARTVDPKNPAKGAGKERWAYLRGSHELYNVGHMYEAAVAYYCATGERSFLDIALKNADMLLTTFGPDKRHDIPGHQEIEIGLAKLYRLTGKKEYLELAKFYLDQRGKPHDSDKGTPDSTAAVYGEREYLQDHKSVLEQEEAVGHAVRAAYMYAGMADVAALGGYPEYVRAIDRLWKNVVGKKMYLTGGIGSRGESEGFGPAYDLPNRTGYGETCASIANALWNYRMFLLHGDSGPVDVFERIIYNGMLSGVSLSGDRFFYENPLESDGSEGRSPWFECACCPPNIVRFLPSLPGYVYATDRGNIYVNLFVAGKGVVTLDGVKISLVQETRYPWDGAIKLFVKPEKPHECALSIRIPGWARNEAVPGDLYSFPDRCDEKPVLKVNGEVVSFTLKKGYARLRRTWQQGDTVELLLPMPVRRIIANEAVKDDHDKVALQRGPIIYCAEGIDNGGHVLNLALPDDEKLEARYVPDLLNGTVVIDGTALVRKEEGKVEKQPFRAIPYYARANRQKSEMIVWLNCR